MIPVTKAYVFESDNEAHINANELSDLSDIFEDTAELSLDEYNSRRGKSERKETSLALEDISYDRDLRNVNVPSNSRQKATLFDPGNRVIKQVSAITSSTSKEIKALDEHYKKLDDKKREADKNASRNAGTGRTENKGGKGQGKAAGDARKPDETGMEGEDGAGKDSQKVGKGRYRQQRDNMPPQSSSNNNMGTFSSKDSSEYHRSQNRDLGYQRRGNRDNMVGKSKGGKHSEFGYFGGEYDLSGAEPTGQYPYNGMEDADVFGGLPPPIYSNYMAPPPLNYYGNYYAHPTQPFEAPILPPLPTIPSSASAPSPLPLPIHPVPGISHSANTSNSPSEQKLPNPNIDQAEADAAAQSAAQVLKMNPFAQEFVPSFMLR